MKNHFPLFAITALMAVGCSGTDGIEDDPNSPVAEKIEIKASAERRTYSSSDVRTTLGSNDEVLWSADDSFVVLDDAGENTLFELVSGAGTSEATFSGYKPKGSSFAAVYGNIYGFYPGSTPFRVAFNLPTDQPYVRGGFGDNVNPMSAMTDNLEAGLSFSNLMGVLELNVTGTKTVDYITVTAESLLAGIVSVDLSTLEWATADDTQSSTSVSLKGINEKLDSATPKSFNIVLPPATYENLRIRIVNTDGTSVVRTAAEPVVIARNGITPVLGLVDGDEARESIVRLSIDETQSTWHSITLRAEMTAECSKFAYVYGSESGIANWKAQNPGASDRDMVLAVGGEYTEGFERTYNVSADITYHFYAIGYDADGNEDGLVHIEHTPRVPYDDNLSVEVSVPAENIGENSAKAVVAGQGGVDRVCISIYNKSVLDYNSLDVIFRTVALEPGYALSMNGGSKVEQDFGNLLPDSEYAIFCVGMSADGKYARLAYTVFRTDVHQASEATVGIGVKEIEDVRASFDMVLGGSAVSYKTQLFTANIYNDYVARGLNIADFVAADGEGPVADSEFSLSGIEADTEYVLCAVAYDAAGSYGSLSTQPFRTQQLFPVYDEEYEAMLGEWTVDYTDFGSGERVTGGLTVSIGRDVDGKTFRVSGLAPDSRNSYGIDDTVIAKFVNGQICFVASTPVADAGALGERYDVILCIVGGKNLYTGGFISGVRTDDTIAFPENSYGVSGCVIYAIDKSTGAGAGSVGPVLCNMEFNRVKPSSSGASTQRFDRAPALSPEWR